MRSIHLVPSIHQNGSNFAQNTRFIVATSFSSSSVAPPLNCTFKLQIEVQYGNVDYGDGIECPGKDDDDNESNLLAADIKPLKIEHGWVLISHLNLDLDGDFDAQEFEPNRPKLRSFEEKNRNSVESMIIWQKELSRILDSNLSVSIFDQKEVL